MDHSLWQRSPSQLSPKEIDKLIVLVVIKLPKLSSQTLRRRKESVAISLRSAQC